MPKRKYQNRNITFADNHYQVVMQRDKEIYSKCFRHSMGKTKALKLARKYRDNLEKLFGPIKQHQYEARSNTGVLHVSRSVYRDNRNYGKQKLVRYRAHYIKKDGTKSSRSFNVGLDGFTTQNEEDLAFARAWNFAKQG